MTAWLTGATSAVILAAMGIAAIAGGAAGGRVGGPEFAAGALRLYGLYALQPWWVLRRIGSFGLLTALLFPLPLAFFHGIFARSVWLAAGERYLERPEPRRTGRPAALRAPSPAPRSRGGADPA
jgi:4,4'-diaponeurosporenoate glycosyltransferase